MFKWDRLRQYLTTRQFAYKRVFDNPNGEKVLADLANFCRAADSTFHENDRVAANLDGRREVFLRIQKHLQLSPDELFEIMTGQAESDKQTLAEPNEE